MPMEKNPVYELPAQEYNLKLAEALKKIPEFKQPEWVEFVKSGAGKARPIDDPDFWYKRAASILRQVYRKDIVGVNRLKTKYGSKKKRGARPEEFRRAGGKIIRAILQQSDKAGFTEIVKAIKGVKEKKPGRKLTEKGKKFLEEIK
jgi:small subunit ribosomal protein S19e